MAMDSAIALGIQPLKIDVATPLMQAAKIRQEQVETQQRVQAMQQDAAGQFARGVAVYADKPEFAQKWSEGLDDLHSRGLMPTQAYESLRNNPSPLVLQSIIAKTEKPELALHREQFTEAKRHAGVIEAQGQQKINLETLKPEKIGTDAFGGEIFGSRNPKAPGGYDIIDPKALRATAGGAPAGPGATGGAPAPTTKPPTAQETKDLEFDTKAGRNVEYLGTLEPDQRGIVRKIANYEMNPNSLSIKGGHRERVLAAVANFAPDYDQKNFAAFQEGLKKFQSGKEGASVRSFNVGIEHLDQLGELGKALNNPSNTQGINRLWNFARSQLGYEGPTNFNGLKQIVGAEIVKAIVGAGGGVGEREEAAKVLAAWNSPEQTEGIIRTLQTAMGAQLGGLQRQYEQSTGRKDFDRLLSSQAIRARDAHTAHAPAGGGSVPAAGASAAAPVTSGKTTSGITWSVQ